MAKPEFYTVKDIAEMFQCSIDTVRRWIRAGRLECTKAGHVIRVTPQQLAKFQKENKGGDSVRREPKPLYNKDGSPRYMGGSPRQPEVCPHCGEVLKPARDHVYTDQPGVYAIFENGQPTGLFYRTIGGGGKQ